MKLITRHPDLGTLLPIYLAPDDGSPPAGGMGSPEDRLAVLEASNAKLAAELAATKLKAAALEGAVESAKAIEARRRAGEVAAYMGGLRRQAAPNAIPEGDLARVQALFDGGQDDTARFVGDLLLKSAKGPDLGGTIVSFGPTANGDQEAAKRGAAELLALIPDKKPQPRRRG